MVYVQLNKKKKRLFFVSVMSILLYFSATSVVMGASGNDYDNASNIDSSEHITPANNDVRVPAKYGFIAEFIPGKTEIEMFGCDNASLMCDTDTWSYDPDTGARIEGEKGGDSKGASYVSFNPYNNKSLKGDFGVWYRNVGTFDGETIDLKITVLDWDRYIDNTSGKISFRKTAIAENVQGFSDVDQKWEFYDSKTGEKVKVSGYMTINDIDVWQHILFDKNTTNSLYDILVPKEAMHVMQEGDKIGLNNTEIKKSSHSYGKTQMGFFEKDGGIGFKSNNGVNLSDTDKSGMFTILFEDTDTLRFKWGLDESRKRASHKSQVFLDTAASGDFFGYIAQKPAKTEMLEPYKRVATGNKEDTSLDVSADDFVYNLYHRVPAEWAEFYYEKYSIEDKIDDRLQIKDVKVFDQGDNDVSNYFTLSTKNNTVNLIAKKAQLNKAAFYGKTYRVQITVEPKDYDALRNDVKNGNVTFKNEFTVTSDDGSKPSNNVTAKLHEYTVTADHLDKYDDTLLVRDTEKKFNGESYSHKSKTDLDNDGRPYTPSPEDEKSGKIKGKDVNLKFFYTSPLVNIDMGYIRIDTDLADEGLPVQAEAVSDAYYNTSLGKVKNALKDNDVTFGLYLKDSDELLDSSKHKLNNIPDKLMFDVPSDGLEKDAKANYEVRIVDPDAVYMTTEHDVIDTDGYTSEETHFDIENHLDYEGVIATERYIGEDMNVFHESLTLDAENQEGLTTGYGVDLGAVLMYTNELKQDALLSNADEDVLALTLDDALLDGENPYGDDTITMVRDDLSKQNNTTWALELKLPEVFVSKNSGELSTEPQEDTISGGKALFAPIWPDELSSYRLAYASKQPFTVNHITFDVESELDFDAYMFSHTDSDTPDKDEILLHPVESEKEGTASMNEVKQDWYNNLE